MTPQREDMDDAIDRIAAATTFVPADPALAREIALGIRAGTRSVVVWPQLAAATVVAALIVAVFAIPREKPVQRTIAPTPRVEQTVPVVEATPAATAAPAVVQRPVSMPRDVRKARNDSAEVSSGIPQIEALHLPPPLAVRELPFDSLTIAPVDLAPIELRDLPLAVIDNRDSPKE